MNNSPICVILNRSLLFLPPVNSILGFNSPVVFSLHFLGYFDCGHIYLNTFPLFDLPQLIPCRDAGFPCFLLVAASFSFFLSFFLFFFLFFLVPPIFQVGLSVKKAIGLKLAVFTFFHPDIFVLFPSLLLPRDCDRPKKCPISFHGQTRGRLENGLI